MPVSIIDIAAYAGVSKSTVSAVINGHKNVKTSTRQRVLEAIEQLDYHPNLAARELITATKTNIGIIMPVYENALAPQGEQYFSSINEVSNFDIVSLLIEKVSKTKYGLLMEHVVISGEEPELPAFVTHGRVAGVFQISPLFSTRFIQRLSKYVSCVVEIGTMNQACDSVYSDFVQTCERSVQYLVNRGHRRIAFINCDPSSRTVDERMRGYERGLANAGIALDDAIVRCAPFTGVGGYRAFSDIWANCSRKPTAVICSSDVVVGGAVRYMHENGIRIPDQVSVISNEDGILCEFITPAVTTISRDKKMIAEMAFSLLMERLKVKDAPAQSVYIPDLLIERQSVRDIR